MANNNNTNSSFSATVAIINVAKALTQSADEVLAFYYPEVEQLSDFHSEDASAVSDSLQNDIKQLGDLLGTTPLETFFLASMYAMEANGKYYSNLKIVSELWGLTGLDADFLSDAYWSLLSKGLVWHRENGPDVVSGLARRIIDNNVPCSNLPVMFVDKYNFCKTVHNSIQSYDCEKTDKLAETVVQLEADGQNLTYVKNVVSLLPEAYDRLLFYELCYQYYHSDIRNFSIYLNKILSSLYNDEGIRLSVGKAICKQGNALITHNLISLTDEKNYFSAIISLGKAGKQLFWEEDYEFYVGADDDSNQSDTRGRRSGGYNHWRRRQMDSEMDDMYDSACSDLRLTSPDRIPDRQLIFDDNLQTTMNRLTTALTEDKFAQVQSRLKECKLPTGVCVLMHGLPGTGKTASAEMLAKATGRSLYHVDIASSKSEWFGESEKLFKKIFDDYRRMCETEALKPILLFNEADSLFSKRVAVDTHNCAQIENALQNILLEEMEKFEGILIATTNMTNNLDGAFERRFLFKIQFRRPDVQALTAIWRSKAGWLSDAECRQLATEYDFTGGEIDNIVRKCEIDYVIDGNYPDLEQVRSKCDSEKLHVDSTGKIGF